MVFKLPARVAIAIYSYHSIQIGYDMAKLVVLEHGKRLWALTEAEDFVILDAIDKMNQFARPDDTRWGEMKSHYLDYGRMFADHYLMHLNGYLKRKGHAPIVLRNGHSDSHSVLNGQDKALIRRDILEQLRSLNAIQRELVLKDRHNQIDMQPDRNIVHDARQHLRAEEKGPPSKLAEQLGQAERLFADRSKTAIPTLPAKGTRVLEVTTGVRLPADTKAEPQPMPSPDRNPTHQTGDHHNTGRVWMHRGFDSRRIPGDQVERWVQQGWVRGMGTKPPAAPMMPERRPVEAPPRPEPTMIETPALDDIDLDAIEAALAARQPTPPPTLVTPDEVEAIRSEVAGLKAELSRLKRIVMQVATAA